jgi:hypothetical protein
VPSTRRSRSNKGSRRSDPATPPDGRVKTPSTGERQTVVVLGAGADHAYGVPLVGSLLPELANYAKSDGRPVHDAIRKKLPYIRFTFDKLAGDTSHAFLTRLFSGGSEEVAPLRSSVEKLKVNEEYVAVGRMLDQICTMAEKNQLGGSDLKALGQVAGSSTDMGDMDYILDPSGLTLTELPATALRTSFHRALMELDTFDSSERSALELFIASMSNIEQMLSEFFTLFLTGRSGDQKNYLYIIWMLWAFMQSKSHGRLTKDDSIYAKLPTLTHRIITLNYTNFFLPPTRRRVQYFHGRLDDVLHLDTRVVSTANLSSAAPNELAAFVSTLRLDVKQTSALDVPAIVPPTSFKPLMSRQQLLSWAKADEFVQLADVVIVVGYSFAAADEHFNGMLRDCTARIVVVNPDLDSVSAAAANALGVDISKLTDKEFSGFRAKTSRRLSCLGATAEQLDGNLVDLCLA